MSLSTYYIMMTSLILYRLLSRVIVLALHHDDIINTVQISSGLDVQIRMARESILYPRWYKVISMITIAQLSLHSHVVLFMFIGTNCRRCLKFLHCCVRNLSLHRLLVSSSTTRTTMTAKVISSVQRYCCLVIIVMVIYFFIYYYYCCCCCCYCCYYYYYYYYLLRGFLVLISTPDLFYFILFLLSCFLHISFSHLLTYVLELSSHFIIIILLGFFASK